ncbi:probable 3-hydroxyisobutyrate dehydrogenase, mitochondrial isoform X2 [Amborella trichopoda]|uniref:probable 3-hydroxyisobutyrate dehydrogenase, mitochondrial isoform X2 n=1 Tax=Amborella trichopoda TaxID=13333 RepID=UPI0009C0D899|nr:probable 3-hydroxyisobutyrate dehydrogenase, mitochondrial isoform X2 [Amborella trichopoda]|eukprot:XP_020518695.1 probable 3-hydroxyisobutyrate dehydrogenase, mitochondrial isoform X2 [Amborella trichopoda]
MAFSKVKVLSTFLNWSLQSPKPHCLRFFSSFIQPQLQRVGFIGLGNMGSRMVNNLINAGYEVSVHDVNSDAIEKFSKKGIHARETPFEIAESSDVIVTMLPSSSSVLDVYTGPNGLLHGGTLLRPWLLIDSSTIDPQTSRRIAAIISKHTLKEKKGSLDVPMMLDAPVSGGVVGAEAGNLTFMKSSIYRLVVQRRLTWLQSHCFLQWGNIQSIAVEVVLGPDSYNPVPGVMDGVPSSKNYDGGFSCKLMAKDLGLAAAAAEDMRLNCPWTRQALLTYSELCKAGHEAKDFSCVFRHYYSGHDENL